MTPIVGFAPDVDKTTPGVLTDCENLIPYLNGMKAAPAPVTPSGVPALAAACQGAAVVTKLDGTRRIIAGTQTKLYELSAGAWVDRSRAGNYTGGTESRWSITQFGDATLCANRADTIQRSTSGAFADISGAPKAEVIFTVGNFVMALNVNDGTEKPDGWHCCAAFDDTSWTPSVTTQATSGRLVATAGNLVAGARLGEYAVAYKEKSIYLGQYVGAPVVWDWIQVPGGEAGCVGKDAICDIGGVHFFVGANNIWLFDGTRPVPIADGVVRQWFYDNLSQAYAYKIICSFDRQTNLVWIFYPSNNSSSIDSALVYHVVSKKWGKVSLSIQAAMNYISSGATIDGLTGTIDALPDIPFDSPYWLSGSQAFALFNTSNQLQTLSGMATTSSLTSGDVGDDEQVSLLQQIRLRYEQSPTSATVSTFSKMNSGDSYINGVTGAAINDGKFDTLRSARWHKAKIDFVGDVAITAMTAKLKAAGRR